MKLVRGIAAFVGAIGAAGLAAHHGLVPSVAMGWGSAPDMVPVTAASLLLCAIAAWAMTMTSRSATVVVATCAGWILGLMWLSALTALLKLSTGVEGLFGGRSPSRLEYLELPGLPSIGTIVGIMAFGLACGAHVLSDSHRAIAMVTCGATCVAVSVVGLLGHALGVPWMFYYRSGLSAGIAIPTAAAIGLLGVIALRLRRIAE